MPPGMPYIVLTSEDCLTVGGHFYSVGTLHRTLGGLVLEYYLGPLISDASHSPVITVLFRYAADLLRQSGPCPFTPRPCF